jgi:hypothetical protein
VGQKHGKATHGINSKRTKQLVKETNFNDAEVSALAIHFEGISSKVGGEQVIDRNQFKAALGFKDSLFLNRMFMLFDTDGDGQINFEEFVTGISMMCESGDFTEKVQCKCAMWHACVRACMCVCVCVCVCVRAHTRMCESRPARLLSRCSSSPCATHNSTSGFFHTRAGRVA